MFTLCVDHGRSPHGAGYAYAVAPSALPGVKVNVVANSGDVQAVAVGDRWGGAVLWKAGRLEISGRAVEASAPCVVMITEGNGRQLHVADPTQRLESVALRVDGRAFDVKLPRGVEAGRSTAVSLDP